MARNGADPNTRGCSPLARRTTAPNTQGCSPIARRAVFGLHAGWSGGGGACHQLEAGRADGQLHHGIEWLSEAAGVMYGAGWWVRGAADWYMGLQAGHMGLQACARGRAAEPPHRHVQLARTRRERLRGRADRDVGERADLQPYVSEAATLGARGCNPVC
eukprot:scaffold10655_cov65-Phaeocystis_antarctica.AAC.3